MTTQISKVIIMKHLAIVNAILRGSHVPLFNIFWGESVTFTARYGVIPVSADAMQTGEGGLSQQSVAWQALKRNGHPHTVVLTDHYAVTKWPRVRTPLELVRWGQTNQNMAGVMTFRLQRRDRYNRFGSSYPLQYLFLNYT